MTDLQLTCSHCQELVGGYLLDALERAESEAVGRHLSLCATCADHFTELAGVPALLDLAAGPPTIARPTPSALEQAILRRFAEERRPPPSGRTAGSGRGGPRNVRPLR